jgi:PTS system nitrogen regulatory IIA component
MRLTDILTEQRIWVDARSSLIRDKDDSLVRLGSLLSPAVGLDEQTAYRLLLDRERLQSTGIGDGVAIPHASTDVAAAQAAALLICPSGIDFQAIDGGKVFIVFGVIGPRRATGEHLKTLARISRLLRDVSNRNRLIASVDSASAYGLVASEDGATQG